MITYPMYLVTKIVYQVFNQTHTEHLPHHTLAQATQYAQNKWNTAIVLSIETYMQPALYQDATANDLPF